MTPDPPRQPPPSRRQVVLACADGLEAWLQTSPVPRRGAWLQVERETGLRGLREVVVSLDRNGDPRWAESLDSRLHHLRTEGRRWNAPDAGPWWPSQMDAEWCEFLAEVGRFAAFLRRLARVMGRRAAGAALGPLELPVLAALWLLPVDQEWHTKQSIIRRIRRGAEAVGLNENSEYSTDPRVVKRILVALEGRGLVEQEPGDGKHRGWKLLDPGRRAVERARDHVHAAA